jgi:hypothetical protein
MSEQLPPVPNTTAPDAPARHSVLGKLLLVVSAALFVGWIAWLGYTALTKSHAPIVSRAQAAAATVPVRAKLTTGEQDREVRYRRPNFGAIGPADEVFKERADKPAFVVEVIEPLLPGGPAAGAKIGVKNLPDSAGYIGPDQEYLLLLKKDNDALIGEHPSYVLVGQQRSPGAELEGSGPPMIYPWSEDVRQQVKRLFP